MYDSCLLKQQNVKNIFIPCKSEEEKYHKIIELGRALKKLNSADRIPLNLVKGCQSIMYLSSTFEKGVIHFQAESDALISAGLASLLLQVYDGETPETILKCPPKFLEELGISASLTPSRANGLYSIHLKMKQEALKHLIAATKD